MSSHRARRGDHRHDWRLLAFAALAAAAASCGGDSRTKTSEAALSGSTFESNDGNLIVDTTGNQDWANAPNLQVKVDLPSGTTDNAFGQGTKEDNPSVSVVTGSIPPNKSDLSRFYVAHENASGNFFLYLAWERTNVLGSANMDFEFNQANQTLSDNSSGPVTIVRTAGDMLITFDFTNGGGNPVLGLLRWVTSGPVSQCFSANSVPCWGNRVDLSAAGFADGAVNTVTVTDPINPNAPRSLPALTFGEAAINLTGANIFPPGQCVNFASVFLKSRSSASFTAELKDFIAPASANISNCGTVNIHKQDDLGAPLAGAIFTLFTDNPPIDGLPPHGAEDTITAYTCTTNASGDCSIPNVLFGNYWAVETQGVPNHDLAPDKSFTLSAAVETVSLTFVDPRSKGAIVVTKTAKNKNFPNPQPLAGATFELRLSGSNTVLATKVSDANGKVCFNGADGVIVGSTYTVTESAAPLNYAKDTTTTQSVSISDPADCTGNGKPAQLSFSNAPLSKITVLFESKAGAGVTAATIQCTGDSSQAPLPEGTPPTGGKVLDNLIPGTYQCTVIVDP